MARWATTITTARRCSMPLTTDMHSQRRLLQLLHLCSPSLPVGGYAYSQGLEGAVDLGWVSDAASLEGWLHSQLRHSLAHLELPVVQRCHAASAACDLVTLEHWNAWLLACRETEELRMGDTATGAALARLLPSLNVPVPKISTPTFLALFASAGAHWCISAEDCLAAYAWIWLENQVLAATKLIPLGQTRAQQLLIALQNEVVEALTLALAVSDDEVGASLMGLAIASQHHETQYSRLFRS
jgi:urease accessory protein